MLSDRAAQLDAEEDSNDHSSIWRDIYTLFRCPSPPCDLGPHCWISPVGKKHYKLRTHHLRALIDFIEQGNPLQSHNNVPNYIVKQLVAEEQQRLTRPSNAPANAPTPLPPINITNVLPSSHQPSIASSVESSTHSVASFTGFRSLQIPGAFNNAVELYSKWLQSKFTKEWLKEEVQKACDVALDEGLDLEQISTNKDPKFFAEKGVKRGVSRRFVYGIPE